MSNRIYYSEEAEQSARRQRMMDIVMFISLGIGLGSMITLLLAPNDGERTRRFIAQTLGEGYQAARRPFEPDPPKMRERVSDMVNRVTR